MMVLLANVQLELILVGLHGDNYYKKLPTRDANIKHQAYRNMSYVVVNKAVVYTDLFMYIYITVLLCF